VRKSKQINIFVLTIAYVIALRSLLWLADSFTA